ncbi:MAG TPA: hypothetical protein DCX07_06655 [Phycisphaerales bacterium]|nr:hypothetical protein [Phycisphaerales bacterium]
MAFVCNVPPLQRKAAFHGVAGGNVERFPGNRDSPRGDPTSGNFVQRQILAQQRQDGTHRRVGYVLETENPSFAVAGLLERQEAQSFRLDPQDRALAREVAFRGGNRQRHGRLLEDDGLVGEVPLPACQKEAELVLAAVARRQPGTVLQHFSTIGVPAGADHGGAEHVILAVEVVKRIAGETEDGPGRSVQSHPSVARHFPAGGSPHAPPGNFEFRQTGGGEQEFQPCQRLVPVRPRQHLDFIHAGIQPERQVEARPRPRQTDPQGGAPRAFLQDANVRHLPRFLEAGQIRRRRIGFRPAPRAPGIIEDSRRQTLSAQQGLLVPQDADSPGPAIGFDTQQTVVDGGSDVNGGLSRRSRPDRSLGALHPGHFQDCPSRRRQFHRNHCTLPPRNVVHGVIFLFDQLERQRVSPAVQDAYGQLLNAEAILRDRAPVQAGFQFHVPVERLGMRVPDEERNAGGHVGAVGPGDARVHARGQCVQRPELRSLRRVKRPAEVRDLLVRGPLDAGARQDVVEAVEQDRVPGVGQVSRWTVEAHRDDRGRRFGATELGVRPAIGKLEPG